MTGAIESSASRITGQAHLQLLRADVRKTATKRQLLLDVSNIARQDARTGIQRVVRAIVSALQRLAVPGISVVLVAADRSTSYRRLPDDWLEEAKPGRELRLVEHPSVNVRAGDIFLGLDFASSILPHHEKTVADWRRRGVEIKLFVYDLLPLTHGKWFTFRMRRNVRRWLDLIERHADGVIAISQSVSNEFVSWQQRPRIRRSQRVPVWTAHLGSDISATMPSRGLPQDSSEILSWLEQRPTILMVGTVEPRKGYAQAIAAFQWLWRRRANAPQLLVIGRGGWKTRQLQQKMRRMSHRNERFIWLDGASDEFLEEIYRRAAGLLVASEGEGFGLPIVEALSHDRRVLARDLPVFRELAGPGMTYFRARSGPQLGQEIESWLNTRQDEAAIALRRTATWDETAASLVSLLIPGQHLNQDSDEAECELEPAFGLYERRGRITGA